MQSKHNLWYFPLESVKSRYTEQLCNNWMPPVLVDSGLTLRTIAPIVEVAEDINVGVVLDAESRVRYSYAQCQQFISHIFKGEVLDGDTVYLQDFYTPGFDGVLYALSIAGINVRLFSMCHAQSVDQYDFTHPMAYWMRDYELMMDKYTLHHGGAIFVASGCHAEELRLHDFRAPTHVVGLPIDSDEVSSYFPNEEKINQVVYSSRMDKEKNPQFMVDVAEAFLYKYKDWRWVCTTSSKEFRSNDKYIVERLRKFAAKNKRFVLREDQSKMGYYKTLAESKIQFNCADQDYVSWTLLEAACNHCMPCYPNFRSFPECIKSKHYLYKHQDLPSAIAGLSFLVDKTSEFSYEYWRTELLTRIKLGRATISSVLEGMEESRTHNIWSVSSAVIRCMSKGVN